ncbi:hypothetical protein BH11ARM1_BH11ARM1_11320 [soil metagenome]
MIQRATSADPAILGLLRKHPKVERVEVGGSSGIEFEIGHWSRAVVIDDLSVEIKGLVEMMDNNPMVCADVVSIPSGAATLALIAFGPLIDAGILVEPPTFLASDSRGTELIADWLKTVGWSAGVTLHDEPQELGSILAATGMAAIRTPADLEDIDELYAERFGRSFFVRRNEEMVWATSLVEGQPYACYRMRITPDEPYSLLSLSLLGDRNGKAGAGSAVHAMNVMAGFEESLGVA